MQKQSNVVARGEKRRRSVTEILARRQKRRSRRRIFPPDFVHGDVAVGSIYETLGAGWAERALLVVDRGRSVTVGYFDDYFLVVEHWSRGDGSDWRAWWDERRQMRDRIVALRTGPQRRLGDEVAVTIDVDRRRLRRMERNHLGVVREAGCRGVDDDARRCGGEIDLLSLVALTSRMCSE